jgi:hypothetical protein
LLAVLVSFLLIAGIMPIVFALALVPAKIQPSGVNVPDVAKSRVPLVEPGTLEKTIFIHYAKSSKPAGAKAPTCYKLLGAKWKSLPINYVVNPTGSGLTEDALNDVLNAIKASTTEWDSHTSATLFGTGEINYSANWDSDYPDGINEYSWGNYSEPGVIAVTVVWSGIPLGGKGRQIIDYDVMFDMDWIWGNADPDNNGVADNLTVMDLQNIATHETGHGIGLADVYDTACNEVTMYGQSTYGEIIKRDLAQPDIIGLQKLYGV